MSKPIRLVAVAEALQAAAASSLPSAPAFGYRREALVQILSSTPSTYPGLELLAHVNPTAAAAERTIELALDGTTIRLELVAGVERPEICDIIHLADGQDARRAGLVTGLESSRVVLAGAGSLGSQIGLLLAQAGVGAFEVLDNDVLSAENLSRHACDVVDLGREKAVAVSDLLSRRGARAAARSCDLCALSDEEFHDCLSGAALVVATTDSPQAQFIVNEACLKAHVPLVAVGAYERAQGGEVLTLRPGQGPCLYCAVGFRAQVSPDLNLGERRQAYQAADTNRLDAEPGLAADISYLASTAAAYALAVLDPDGSRADLLSVDRSFVLVHGGSRPHEGQLFRQPFDLVYAQVARTEPCPVCGFVSAGHA